MSARKIVVTGVTRGIGRAMVAGFIAAGHHVAGCGRSADAIAALTQEYPAPHRFDIVDVTNNAQVEHWAESLIKDFGTPDLLINNAAVINQSNPLWEVPVDEFSRLIDINVKGVFHVVRALVPTMAARGSGVIINLSSGWGRSTSPDVAPYCASKFAVEGLTRAMAQELPASLAAIPLSPGVIHTEMLETCMGAAAADHPTPDRWAEKAVPYILGLGPADNGQPLAIPHG